MTSLDAHGRRVRVTGPFAARFSDHNRNATGGPRIHVIRPGDPIPEDCNPLGVYDVPIGDADDVPICVTEPPP